MQQATYKRGDNDLIAVGQPAYVVCGTHPNSDLNNRPISTTRVLEYDKGTGVFKTLNTTYTPE